MLASAKKKTLQLTQEDNDHISFRFTQEGRHFSEPLMLPF